MITEDGSKSNASENTVVNNSDATVTAATSSRSSSASPPQLSKVTAFEFMQVWNSLKGTNNIEQYVSILEQIQPSDIPKGEFIIVFDMRNSYCMHPACITLPALLPLQFYKDFYDITVSLFLGTVLIINVKKT